VLRIEAVTFGVKNRARRHFIRVVATLAPLAFLAVLGACGDVIVGSHFRSGADASDGRFDARADSSGDANPPDGNVASVPTYIKASNTRADARFSTAAMDGDTLVVGSPGESSAAKTINGVQGDTSAPESGAVYVFKRTAGVWAQEAYIKPFNNLAGNVFGVAVAISGDTLAVGAVHESSASASMPNDTTASHAGAVYVFQRAGSSWTPQAYLKAAVPRPNAEFGTSLALKADTLVVGATGDSSAARTINGDQSDTGALDSGAAYVFTRAGAVWTQAAYLKPSNNRAGARFGASVSVDGDSIAVGASSEASKAKGVGGDEMDTSAPGAGAVYVFVKSGDTYAQQAYIKASNTTTDANLTSGFGSSLCLSANMLAVGQHIEPSNAKGIDGDDTDTSAPNSGAVFVFERTGTAWAQQAYIKPSNTRSLALFGFSLSLVGDKLVVGSQNESSNAKGVNGDDANTSAPYAGAAYEFKRTGTTWTQTRYLKASNTRADALFGYSLAATSTHVAVGSRFETSAATGVDGNQADTSAPGAGAVYVYP
jgi:hypothetical protein